MATAWVRSLSCRSYGVADAVVAPSPSKKAQPLLPVSWRRGGRAGLVASARQAWKQQKLRWERRTDGPRRGSRRQEAAAQEEAQADGGRVHAVARDRARELGVPDHGGASGGHLSRQVVELIFSSGRRHRAHGAAARCGADGNEMMRFQCRPAAGADAGGVFSAGVATCQLGPSGSAVRTFACSGAAHARAAPSPGAGRRAMLVCRVIAGRVRQAHGDDMQALRHRSSQYDSVDMGNGELVVLDSRAVLPASSSSTRSSCAARARQINHPIVPNYHPLFVSCLTFLSRQAMLPLCQYVELTEIVDPSPCVKQ
ncbi:hypothetical protein ZWY2020_005697 [Hordeum vulgare]|nr:hypothetical protein ZWY2020_005697 [Hordeum vulgare]